MIYPYGNAHQKQKPDGRLLIPDNINIIIAIAIINISSQFKNLDLQLGLWVPTWITRVPWQFAWGHHWWFNKNNHVEKGDFHGIIMIIMKIEGSSKHVLNITVMWKFLKTLHNHHHSLAQVIMMTGMRNGSHGLGLPDLSSSHLLHGGFRQSLMMQITLWIVNPNQGADNPVSAAKA